MKSTPFNPQGKPTTQSAPPLQFTDEMETSLKEWMTDVLAPGMEHAHDPDLQYLTDPGRVFYLSRQSFTLFLISTHIKLGPKPTLSPGINQWLYGINQAKDICLLTSFEFLVCVPRALG